MFENEWEVHLDPCMKELQQQNDACNMILGIDYMKHRISKEIKNEVKKQQEEHISRFSF